MGLIARIACLIVAGGLVCAAGCSSSRLEWNRGELAAEPFSFNSPAVVLGGQRGVGTAAADAFVAVPRSWDARNDARLGVRPGPFVGGDGVYEVYTSDRLRVSGDRVHDHYDRRFRAVEYGRIYR